mmetsp:Transcript_15781/g.43497  ORF Transcript_15781/g.43497 Transcript_15781/m.43497 type:complete len:208 (+) Transcript_15781:171-794(+)
MIPGRRARCPCQRSLTKLASTQSETCILERKHIPGTWHATAPRDRRLQLCLKLAKRRSMRPNCFHKGCHLWHYGTRIDALGDKGLARRRRVSPCIFGAPAWPAASADRLRRVCEATQVGNTSEPLPDDAKLDPVEAKAPLPVPAKRIDAVPGESDGLDRLRPGMDALDARGSELEIVALRVALCESAARGDSFFSYHAPSLPLPKLP